MRALALCLVVAAAPALAQEAQRGYIGIRPAELTPELRTEHKVADGIDRGLILIQVFEDTAAAKAGLRPGDVLTSFDNKPVNSIEELLKLLDGMAPGGRVAYVARRGTGTIAGLLVLGEPPAEGVERRGVVIEEPMAPKPVEKPAGELDERMDRLTRDIEALRERAEKRRAAAAAGMKPGNGKQGEASDRARQPRNIVGWMEAEELAIVAAKKSGNERAVQWHSARMQMLRELREAGYREPNTQRRENGQEREGVEKRMRMLEKQLAEVLERLARLER